MKGLVKVGTLFSIAALVGVTAFGAALPADAHCHNWRHYEHQRYEQMRWQQRAMYNNPGVYNNAYYNNPYAYQRPSLFTRAWSGIF